MAELVAKARPYRHWLALFPLCVGGIWFTVLQQIVREDRYLLYIPLDDYIPFLPAFIIPYVVWYFYVGGVACYLFRRAPQEFVKNAHFLAGGMLIACFVYTVFPNGQALRPDLTAISGPLHTVIRLLYRIDPPTNSAPSLHVIFSIAAHSALKRYVWGLGRFRWAARLSFLVSLSCICATVFIKQHSVVDLVAGLFVAGLLYIAIYVRPHQKAPNPVR